MKFNDAINESHIGGKNNHDPGKPEHLDTGISPTGHVTGEYGEELLRADGKKVKKKNRFKKKQTANMAEGLAVTGTKDVTGVPRNIEAYADKKKKDKIVRRRVGITREKM